MIQTILNRSGYDPEYREIDYLSLFIYDDNRQQPCVKDFGKFIENVKSFLAIWGNTTSTTDKVCAFDMAHFLSIANDWARTQVSQDGILYRLINLSRWNIPNFLSNLFN